MDADSSDDVEAAVAPLDHMISSDDIKLWALYVRTSERLADHILAVFNKAPKQERAVFIVCDCLSLLAHAFGMIGMVVHGVFMVVFMAIVLGGSGIIGGLAAYGVRRMLRNSGHV